MVAAIPAAPTANHHPTHPKNPNLRQEDLPNPTRPPLIPSEKDNAVGSRRPRTKEVTSRYLSSYTSSSSSSSSTSSCRRFPSPLLTPRPSSPESALPSQQSAPKRSHSADRTRPSTPRAASPEISISSAARTLCTTTRSLAVSFQGESFFYQTSKAKAATPNPNPNPIPARKATPERRRTASVTIPLRAEDQSENSRPSDHLRWPAARTKQATPLSRSLDCSLDNKEPKIVAARFLQQSLVFEERRRSFETSDLSPSSDTDSVSSGSNSGSHEPSIPAGRRGISVPARFWQETRLRRLTEPATPLPKMALAKKSFLDSPVSSPRKGLSPLRGPVRPSSPSKLGSSPSRAMASPSRVRSNSTLVAASPIGQPGNAPSIINFAAEVRRAKKGENRIEEAHLLRLCYNRHLQWRFANARVNAALSMQRLSSEKKLYNAWVTTSEMRGSVTIKRTKLQELKQNLKLSSILKGQITYLEQWSLMDREHSSSLSGATEALKASTLRLPVVCGARADVQDVKDAVGSAVDVMQAMGSSICSLLSKVEGTSYLVSELAKVAAQEQALLNQSRDLLCTVAAMHVKQSSRRSHMLQLKRKANEAHL